MLLKLLKYDFRAMWKHFSLIWGAALALSLVNRFTRFRPHSKDFDLNTDWLIMIFVGVVVAMFVISIGFVINRFSKGLLGSEGYLMHTLPVRSWQLVLSKLICGAVTWVISGVAAILALLIQGGLDWSFLVNFLFWKDVVEVISKHPDNLLLILEFCLFLASVIVQFIAAIYLSVSIGHLFVRHRRLAGIAAFIGIYTLLTQVWMLLEDLIWRWINLSSSAHSNLLAGTAVMLIPAAAFLAAVCWILDNKLNLE